MAVGKYWFPVFSQSSQAFSAQFLSVSNMSEHRRQAFAEVYERVKVLQAKKCHDGAIKELNKLIELSEKIKNEDDLPKVLIARAWNDRGHLKYLQVDFYGAVEDFSQAILLDNEFAVPFYNRGQIHYRMGMYKCNYKTLYLFLR